MQRETTRIIIQGLATSAQRCKTNGDVGYKIIRHREFDGGLYNSHGIDIDALLEYRDANKTIVGFQGPNLRIPDNSDHPM